MRIKTIFRNFAPVFTIAAFALAMTACKGRTVENMEPNGDTVEVVILQSTETAY